MGRQRKLQGRDQGQAGNFAARHWRDRDRAVVAICGTTMNKAYNWSDLRCLNDRKGVPCKPGVYIIGTFDGTLPATASEDKFMGENFPDGFHARYFGMSVKPTTGIRGRLTAHARGRGNRQVREHIAAEGIHTLFYIYSECEMAYLAEGVMLRLMGGGLFDWNNRDEMKGSIKKFAQELGPPERMHLDHWEIDDLFEDDDEG
jgi:hypothetical protein